MLRYFIALAFSLHGLAHLSGFVAAWTKREAGFADQPWLLSKNVKLQSPPGKVFGVLWLAAALGLAGAGAALFAGKAYWPHLALAGSLISLAVILPWLKTVPPGARFAGLAFDLLTLLALALPWREQVLAWLK